MSAANVLAVMDACVKELHAKRGQGVADQVRKARAAVAEVRQALAAGCGDGGLSEAACAALLARLDGGAA